MSRNTLALAAAAACLLLAASVAAGAMAAALPPTKAYKSRSEARRAAEALQTLSPTDRAALYRAWRAEHGREDEPLDLARFTTWSANLDDMVTWNLRPDAAAGHFKGLNEYSDMSFAEFADSRLMRGIKPADVAARSAAAPRLPAARPQASRRRLHQTSAPNEWDWRALGKVPNVRNQGGCGSCWAFAGVAALEIKAQIDNVPTPLPRDQSEQQAVDCINSANGYWSMGCNSGYADEVFRYASNLFLTTEAAYPYTAVAGACRVTASSVAPEGSLSVAPYPGYWTVAASPEAIMQAVATKGPVVVYFNVQSAFYSYAGGVFQATSCTTLSVNHAMVVVGYNKTAGVGSPASYWILRNSWGAGWGEQGYAKVQMTADSVGACAMYSALMVPQTTGVPGVKPPAPPPPSPTPSPTPKPCKGRKC